MTYYIAIVIIPETWATGLLSNRKDEYEYYDGLYLAMTMMHPVISIRCTSSNIEKDIETVVEIYKTKIKETLKEDKNYDLSKLTKENMEQTIQRFIVELPIENMKNSRLMQFSIKQIEI